MMGNLLPRGRGPSGLFPLAARCFSDGTFLPRERTAVTAALWEERLAMKALDASAAPPPEDAAPHTLVPKPPKRVTVSYPFSTDGSLRESYRNPWGAVRLGRVLEDLDSLAGNIAYEHCDDFDASTRPQVNNPNPKP
jgi:acyl-coenzyme A thioesterase 9